MVSQIVRATEFSDESEAIVEKLRRLVDLMQLGLQVALLSTRVCAAWTCNVLQAETIEQNNQMLSSLGTLDTKMDSVSSRVDSVSSSVHDIAEKQDSLNKQVGSPLSRRQA